MTEHPHLSCEYSGALEMPNPVDAAIDLGERIAAVEAAGEEWPSTWYGHGGLYWWCARCRTTCGPYLAESTLERGREEHRCIPFVASDR